MYNFYGELRDLFQNSSSAVIATIVKQAGPSPRGLGTKCLIRQDGTSSGTIGGGLLEARTFEESAKVFKTGQPLLLRFSLTGTDVAESDMLCGGIVEVFLHPVSAERPEVLHVFRKMLETANRGGAGVLVTSLDLESWQPGNSPLLFLEKGMTRSGSLPMGLEDPLTAEMERILSSGQPATLSLTDANGRRVNLFVEPVVSDPVLYIFGGGHVSRQIVPLASLVGFNVEVIDDRPEFVQEADFPGARSIHQLPFERVMEKLGVGPSSFLVIVTRGHMHDKTVLEQALRTGARYVGMIGSRRKREIIYGKLLEEGFTREDLARVHSPIGLDIGAETPEEIAVSIVAELIQVRAGGQMKAEKGPGI